MLSLLLVLVLFVQGSSFAEKENDSKTYQMAGVEVGTLASTWSENKFFKKMEEKTGIHLEFDQHFDEKEWEKKVDGYFAGTEPLPDVLFKAELSVAQEEEGFKKNILIDLKPLLEENAPNLFQILQENPQWEKGISLSGGEIVSLPYIDLLRVQNAMWINRQWLDTLGLEAPTTKESFKKVLKAFKEEDPNQNGKKDEVPFSFIGPWDLKFLGHSFGLIANDYNIYINQEEKVSFLPIEADYYDFIFWLRELYQEGLLDPQGFTQSDQMRSLVDEKSPATFGIIMGPTAFSTLPDAHGKQYEPLMPLFDDQGKQIYRDFVGPITRGTFAITTNCSEPEKLLQWVDYLYSEEGATLAMAGEKGVDYTVNAQGKWSIVKKEGSAFDSQNVNIISGAAFPWYSPVAFELSIGDEVANKTFLGMKKLGEIAKLPFPYYSLTREEENQIQPLQKELATYVDENLAKFVLGEVELTEETWQEYLQGFDTATVEAFLSFWQEIYSKFN